MENEIGKQKITELIGKTFSEIEMKRSDNIRSLAAFTTSVKVNDKIINTDPMIFCQRMLVWRKPTDDLSRFLLKK